MPSLEGCPLEGRKEELGKRLIEPLTVTLTSGTQLLSQAALMQRMCETSGVAGSS